MLIQRLFTYHSCDTQHPRTVVHNILFTVAHEVVLLAKCFYQRGLSHQFCLMSKMLLRAVHAVQPVYYGHIGTIHKCTGYQGVPDYPGQFIGICQSTLWDHD